jgi:hypothetical protein
MLRQIRERAVAPADTFLRTAGKDVQMDEVSSHVRLDLPTTAARPSKRSFHLVFESHDGRCYGGGGVDIASIVRHEPMELPMQTLNDLSRSLIALEPASTLIAVIEMSLSSWLVAGIVPGIERQPLKKLAVDESVLLRLLH